MNSKITEITHSDIHGAEQEQAPFEWSSIHLNIGLFEKDADLFHSLKEACDSLRRNEPMKLHTSFKVGGPARFFACPKDADELSALMDIAKEASLPVILMGNGTNLLVRDGGIDGLVIHIGGLSSKDENEFDAIEIGDVVGRGTGWENCTIYAGAGVSLSVLAAKAQAAGLAGLEFASGIPGTLGGAVFMNAGAYDGQISDVIHTAYVLDPKTGKTRELFHNELRFGYRRSVLQETGEIVLEASLMLHPGDPESIRRKMEDFHGRRTAKQPLQYPSAGSFFKRPEGRFAGALIEEAGLKGLMHGGAQVSELHAGFLINKDNATAKDILELAHMVQAVVQSRTGILLEPEVRIVGKD